MPSSFAHAIMTTASSCSKTKKTQIECVKFLTKVFHDLQVKDDENERLEQQLAKETKRAEEAEAAKLKCEKINIELQAAARKAPYSLPYYWEPPPTKSREKFQLRDAYAEGGYNWSCAETMLNDSIHLTCKTAGTNKCNEKFGRPLSIRASVTCARPSCLALITPAQFVRSTTVVVEQALSSL